MKACHWLILSLGIVAVLAASGFVAAGRSSTGAQERKVEENEQPAKGRREAFVAAYDSSCLPTIPLPRAGRRRAAR